MENLISGRIKWYTPFLKAIIIGLLGVFFIYIYLFISEFNPIAINYIPRIDPIFTGFVLLFFTLSMSMGIISITWNFNNISNNISVIIIGGIAGFIWGIMYLVSFWLFLTNVPVSGQLIGEYAGNYAPIPINIYNMPLGNFIILLILMPVVSTITCAIIYYAYLKRLRQTDELRPGYRKLRNDSIISIVLSLFISICLPLLLILVENLRGY